MACASEKEDLPAVRVAAVAGSIEIGTIGHVRLALLKVCQFQMGLFKETFVVRIIESLYRI